jgi:hypothetical protein
LTAASNSTDDALAYALDITEIEQLLASPPAIVAGMSELMCVQGLLRVHILGDRSGALASSYIRRHDPTSGVLRQIGYGRTLLRQADGAWIIDQHLERQTGDPDGPGFLLAGLRPELYLTRTLPSSSDPAVEHALDILDVRSLLVTYGLAADGGSADLVAKLYQNNAGFDIEGVMQEHGGILEIFSGRGHQSLMPWSAHTTGPVLVDIRGDRASSTHYARTYGRVNGDDRCLWRLSINRWDLERRSDGCWKVAHRSSRTPEGGELSSLTARGVREHSVVPPSTGNDGTQHVIDVINIEQHVTSFGFAIDSGDIDLVLGIFDPDARLSMNGTRRPLGEPLAEAVSIPGHVGVAHASEPPTIQVSSDDASAVNLISIYGAVVDGAYPLRRLLKAWWHLRRTGSSWICDEVRLVDVF